YTRPSLEVARDLLGRLLVRTLPDGTRLVGRIVGAEAYREDDPASHSFRGGPPRPPVVSGPPGPPSPNVPPGWAPPTTGPPGRHGGCGRLPAGPAWSAGSGRPRPIGRTTPPATPFAAGPRGPP